MELKANENKEISREVKGEKFNRYAIKTHFVQIGENYIDIIEKYVKPIYKEGDFISISEKIISLCQKRVIYKKDMKVSFLAKFLSKIVWIVRNENGEILNSESMGRIYEEYGNSIISKICGKK